MNLPFFIARKYFLSGKKKNFINVISMISMVVVGIGTMALILALSVFNGLEGLLRSMYGHFDPDLVVQPATGKMGANRGFVTNPLIPWDTLDSLYWYAGKTS